MKTKKLTKIVGALTLFACILGGGVSCVPNPPESYTVTFEFVGAEGSVTSVKKEVVNGEKLSEQQIKDVKSKIPEDYKFDNVYSDKECTKVFDTNTTIAADTTVYVKVNKIEKFKVTFDSDGGSEVKAATVEKGAKVTKPTAPTKDGYTFKGWFNGDKEYAFETAVTSNITLKAKWEVVTYKITYELNNGTGDKDNPTSYTIETDDFTIKDPVSGPGETPNFVGWYSDKDFTKPAVTTITKGSTGNLSFYAKWSAKSTFTVTFNFVGVEGSDSVKVEDGEALTSAQLESVKSKIPSDYVFVDFYTNKECTTKFDVTKTFTADSTLYIKVKVNEIKKFTVTFDSDGGSDVAAAEVKDGEKVKKPADPTKDGYTFKGWLDGDDKEYNFDKAVTANITLKAKWEENKATEPETPPAGGEDDVEEETPKITYLVEKATTEFTVSNQWSQANISGMDKEYKKGDWIVTGGTVSIDGTKKIGQVYLQFGIDGGSKQIGGYYQTDSSQTSTSYTFYWIYRVDEDFKATYAQVACQEESNGKIVALAQDSKFTVSDFYVVHLPKADMAKLTTEIKVADTIEMPYKDHGADNGKGYQLDLEAVNFTTTEGKIVCLYNRPAVKNGWKNHFINGNYVAKGEDGYTAIYPGADAGLISITRDVAAGNTCDWFQIGIVGQDTTEGETLAITDLEVRIIPNF